MYEGRLFVVSGPSGAGKGTICKMLVEQRKDIAVSVSMTTRKPRTGEIEGKSYFFVSRDEFKDKIKEDEFLEYAEVFGNYYGTPKKAVFDTLKKGINVILEIDTQGALDVKKHHPEGVFIFILPPSVSELKKRLKKRGTDTDEAITFRMGEAKREISLIGEYDYCVINDDLNEAFNKANAIITAEHSKVTQAIYEKIKEFKEEL